MSSIKTRLAKVTFLAAALVAAGAAALAHPGAADARIYFPDGANGMAGAQCDGLNWRLDAGTYPDVWFRFHVYDQQRGAYVFTSSWRIVQGYVIWTLPWGFGPGRFSIYADFGRYIGGQFWSGRELAGVLTWRTDIVRGQVFCWNW